MTSDVSCHVKTCRGGKFADFWQLDVEVQCGYIRSLAEMCGRVGEADRESVGVLKVLRRIAEFNEAIFIAEATRGTGCSRGLSIESTAWSGEGAECVDGIGRGTQCSSGGMVSGGCGHGNCAVESIGGVVGVEVKDGTVSSAADGQSCGKVDGSSSSPVADIRTVNQAKRDKNKQRKARKKAEASGGGGDGVPEWRRGAGVLGRNGKPRDPDAVGFWKSCDQKTRQELIRSKAAMHIAENKRKAREAEARFDYLNSPQAAVNQAVKLAEKAKVYGAQAEESIVHGYAQTVSSSNAESMVRSLPDSCTSYSDYAQRKMESEYSEKLNEVCKSNEELEKKVGSLQRQLAESLAAGKPKEVTRSLQSSVPVDSVEVARLKEKVEELEAARLFAMKNARFKGPDRCESITAKYPYGGGKLGVGYSQWD